MTPVNFNPIGKTKQVINSELFSVRQVAYIHPNFVQNTPVISDLLRSRGGWFWSTRGILPEPNISPHDKLAFDLKFNTLETATGSTTFGQFVRNFSLFANKDLYKFDPGFPLHNRSTFNPEYWKNFITAPNVLHDGALPPLTFNPSALPTATTLFNNGSAKNQFGNTVNAKNNAPSSIPGRVSVQDKPAVQTSASPTIVGANIASLNRSNIANVNFQTASTVNSIPQIPPSDGKFHISPTIVNNREFLDFVFDLNIPFTQKEIKELNLPVGVSFFDIKPVYNFLTEKYENFIANTDIPETLLPNIYSFVSELEGTKNTIFKNHITLDKYIPDVFLDVINNKGFKLKKKQNGEYFDKWATYFPTFDKNDKLGETFLKKKFSNIVLPISNVSLFNKYNDKKFLFPMFVDFQFTTDKKIQFAQVLEETQLSSVLLKDIIDGNLVPENRKVEETFITSTEMNGVVKKEASSTGSIARTWDILKWVDTLAKNPVDAFSGLDNGLYLGQTNQETQIASDGQFDLFKNLMVIIFVGKLKTIIKNNFRSFEDLLQGKSAYSENVFYRIEKIDGASGQTIQSFYLPNSRQVDVYNFLDTQVKYNKKYIFKVFTYQMVLGNRYSYTLKNLGNDSANVDVNNQPDLRLVEVLLTEYSNRVMDLPPVPPEVDIVPFRGVSDQVLLRFDSAVGHLTSQPIFLEETDRNIIAQLREAQMLRLDDPLEYETDDSASAFEVFRIERKPSSYQEFVGNRVAFIPTDVDLTSLQTATSAAFIDNILPNKTYYYCFRTVDIHSHISNPTAVFSVEMVDDNGSVYPIIQVVEMVNNEDLTEVVKHAKRFLQVVPSFEQRLINEEKSGFAVNDVRLSSIIGKEEVSLGLAEVPVWGKSFKIRITSKRTGKKIDVNLSFDHQHVVKK